MLPLNTIEQVDELHTILGVGTLGHVVFECVDAGRIKLLAFSRSLAISSKITTSFMPMMPTFFVVP